jgi:hypothetical protein
VNQWSILLWWLLVPLSGTFLAALWPCIYSLYFFYFGMVVSMRERTSVSRQGRHSISHCRRSLHHPPPVDWVVFEIVLDY